MQKELSDKEKQIIGLIATGFGPQEIARKLHRGESTISTHLIRIKRKLGAKSTIQAAIMWATKLSAADMEYLSWGKPRT